VNILGIIPGGLKTGRGEGRGEGEKEKKRRKKRKGKEGTRALGEPSGIVPWPARRRLWEGKREQISPPLPPVSAN